jgi:hypothetical protein
VSQRTPAQAQAFEDAKSHVRPRPAFILLKNLTSTIYRRADDHHPYAVTLLATVNGGTMCFCLKLNELSVNNSHCLVSATRQGSDDETCEYERQRSTSSVDMESFYLAIFVDQFRCP